MIKSNLYKYDKYLDDNIDYIFNKEIIEYDIKSAGLNIIKRFKLLDENKINYLSKLEKLHRDITIGKIQRKDKEFSKALMTGFKECRRMFFDANEIEDDEVLSIKKDAIFLLRTVKNTQFENIKFVNKNEYISYIRLGKYEIYHNSGKIDVKGIADETLKLHEDGMLKFLNTFFVMMESEPNEKKIKKLLSEFAYEYKNMLLPMSFYREFNEKSLFKTNIGFESGLSSYLTNINKDCDFLDISYNYLNVITPLISIVI